MRPAPGKALRAATFTSSPKPTRRAPSGETMSAQAGTHDRPFVTRTLRLLLDGRPTGHEIQAAALSASRGRAEVRTVADRKATRLLIRTTGGDRPRRGRSSGYSSGRRFWRSGTQISAARPVTMQQPGHDPVLDRRGLRRPRDGRLDVMVDDPGTGHHTRFWLEFQVLPRSG